MVKNTLRKEKNPPVISCIRDWIWTIRYSAAYHRSSKVWEHTFFLFKNNTQYFRHLQVWEFQVRVLGGGVGRKQVLLLKPRMEALSSLSSWGLAPSPLAYLLLVWGSQLHSHFFGKVFPSYPGSIFHPLLVLSCYKDSKSTLSWPGSDPRDNEVIESLDLLSHLSPRPPAQCLAPALYSTSSWVMNDWMSEPMNILMESDVLSSGGW